MSKTPWPPLGGGSARRRWGRELHAGTKVSGKGEALSLRPFGPPLPLWRKRHLPRIGGVCLPEGGFLTRRAFPRGGSHICGLPVGWLEVFLPWQGILVLRITVFHHIRIRGIGILQRGVRGTLNILFQFGAVVNAVADHVVGLSGFLHR